MITREVSIIQVNSVTLRAFPFGLFIIIEQDELGN